VFGIAVLHARICPLLSLSFFPPAASLASRLKLESRRTPPPPGESSPHLFSSFPQGRRRSNHLLSYRGLLPSEKAVGLFSRCLRERPPNLFFSPSFRTSGLSIICVGLSPHTQPLTNRNWMPLPPFSFRVNRRNAVPFLSAALYDVTSLFSPLRCCLLTARTLSLSAMEILSFLIGRLPFSLFSRTAPGIQLFFSPSRDQPREGFFSYPDPGSEVATLLHSTAAAPDDMNARCPVPFYRQTEEVIVPPSLYLH